MAVKNWSSTAADNVSGLTGINWNEGMNAAAVNDSARGTLAQIADWYAQIKGGTIYPASIGGTANAITLTCSPTIDAYATGQRFLFKASSTNTGSTTVNVDGLGTKTVKFAGANLNGGEITSGDLVHVAYDGANLQLLSPQRAANQNAVLLSNFASLSAADTAAQAVGGYILLNTDITLGAATTLTSRVVGDVGVITLGDYDLEGDFWAPPGTQMFDCTGTGVVTLTNLWRVPSGWFGVKASNADNINELNAVAACISASGGGTFEVPGGDISISDLFSPTTGVAFIGQGQAFNGGTNYGGTRFLCTAATAGIAIGGRGAANASYGGKIGGFVVDGGAVATNPFYVGRAACRVFEDILVRNSVDDAIWLEETQNCRFVNVNTDAAGAWGLTIDRGAAGNTFYGHENNASVSGGLRFMNQTTGTGVTAYTLNNQFFGCIIERTPSGKVIYHDAGEDNLIYGLNASVFGASVAAAANFIELTSTHSVRFKLDHLTGLTGDITYSTCFKVANGATLVIDRPGKLNNFLNVWDIDTGGSVDIQGKPDYGTNTNKFSATMTGTKNTVMRHKQYGTEEQTLPTTSENARIVLVDGETGQRAVEYTSGLGFTKDGSTFNPTKGVSAFFTGTVTIPSGSTSATLAHGLGTTPSRYSPTQKGKATNAPGQIWFTVDATNITAHCESDPGATGLSFLMDVYL